MNNQKLIMENWRRFLDENQKQPQLLEEDLLEEGILQVLAGMMFVLNIGGQEVQVPTQDIVDAYKTASSQQMDGAKSELGELITNMSDNVKSGAVTPIDSDGDGVKEISSLVTPKLGPEAIKLIQAELADNAPEASDTGMSHRDASKAASDAMASEYDPGELQKQVDAMKRIQK
jgi:hypothetical protein